MRYAQIKDGKVANTIKLEDSALIELFSAGFDAFIRVDEMSPEPGIEWTYDGSQFTAPPPPALEEEQP